MIQLIRKNNEQFFQPIVSRKETIMKSKKYLAAVLTLVFILASVSTVSAKTERIDFTMYESCDESTVQIEREIINGQGNYLAKHWTQTCYETGDIPQVTGILHGDLNLNTVGNGVWMFVAKVQIVTDEGGIWNMNCLYPYPSITAQCIGQGEGMYKGEQIFMTGWPGYMFTGYITYNIE
jgi:hypothetical protein